MNIKGSGASLINHNVKGSGASLNLVMPVTTRTTTPDLTSSHLKSIQ